MISGPPQTGQRPYPPGPPQGGREGRYPGPSPQGQRAYPSEPPQAGQRAYPSGSPQEQGRGPYPGHPGRGRGGPFAGRYPSGPPVPGQQDSGGYYPGGREGQGGPLSGEDEQFTEYEEEVEEEASIDGHRNNSNNNNRNISIMFDDEMEEEILDEEILEEVLEEEIIDEEESTFITKGDAESRSSDGYFSNTAVSFRMKDGLDTPPGIDDGNGNEEKKDNDELKDPYAGTIFSAGEESSHKDSVAKAEEDLLLEIDELEEMEAREEQIKLNDDIDKIMDGIENGNDSEEKKLTSSSSDKGKFAESYESIDVVEEYNIDDEDNQRQQEEENPSYNSGTESDEEVPIRNDTTSDPENASSGDGYDNDPAISDPYYNGENVPIKKNNNNGFMVLIGGCGLVIVLIGIAFLILYFMNLPPFNTTRSISTDAPEIISTLAPTTSKPTTTPKYEPMDLLEEGNCNFDGLNFPDIRAQCRCGSSVLIIPVSVKEKYSTLSPEIGSQIESNWNYRVDSCDAENLALLFLASGNEGIISLSIGFKIQRFVLAQLYYQLDGLSWQSNSNWLSSDSECMWEGVTCTADKLVTEIDLDANTATGKIPSNIAQLQKLRFLSLAENNLSAAIPKGLFDLTELETLDLSGNSLEGELPTNIENAKSLKHLILSYNNLRGIIPETIVGKEDVMLETIALNNNNFEGNVPARIGAATFLRKLDIAANSISDELPTEIYGLKNLEYFSIEKNHNITGRIPTEFGTFKRLAFLSLSETNIRSRFPVEYTNLNKLTTLRISNTRVGAEIPTQIKSMTSLVELDLSKSIFRQNLPKQLGDLTRLTSLKLNSNKMEGSIATELGLLTSLEYLWLDGNKFSGTIPSELGSLTNLKELVLSSNNLSARAPQDICNLRTGGSLEVFWTDCPTRNAGVVCGIPTCCTSCARPLQL